MVYNYKFKLNDALEIKKLSDVNLGKAYIRTVTDGEEIKDYEIEITSINKNSKLKSISFKITDEELLKKAGGIVQGMSGSPIIQDNYLIGAVTHVLVDNVTNGYGVSIITMLDEGDKLIK
jgi:stage IV sporulation protein B